MISSRVSRPAPLASLPSTSPPPLSRVSNGTHCYGYFYTKNRILASKKERTKERNGYGYGYGYGYGVASGSLPRPSPLALLALFAGAPSPDCSTLRYACCVSFS